MIRPGACFLAEHRGTWVTAQLPRSATVGECGAGRPGLGCGPSRSGDGVCCYHVACKYVVVRNGQETEKLPDCRRQDAPPAAQPRANPAPQSESPGGPRQPQGLRVFSGPGVYYGSTRAWLDSPVRRHGDFSFPVNLTRSFDHVVLVSNLDALSCSPCPFLFLPPLLFFCCLHAAAVGFGVIQL